jgi:hypothetical protein
MTDPAVEAAKRAWGVGYPSYPRNSGLIVAAREALAPLRELHQPVNKCCDECGGNKVCSECEWPWPCATAKLTYRDDEL